MYICCVLVVTKKSFSKSKMHGATVKKSFMGIKTQWEYYTIPHSKQVIGRF